MSPAAVQRMRRSTQAGFFVLFLLAPALNLLRFDLYETQLWVLGMRWSLHIDALRAGQASAMQTGIDILLRGIIPVVVLAIAFLTVAYRYGRLYCGWLCPHFSGVEMLNNLLHRACGKFSIWEKSRTPRAGRQPQARWWPLFLLSCALMGFLWSITLLTYLLPPDVIWSGLLHQSLSANQLRFILIAGAVFTLEFAVARHLFCRFGCAVGLFQSLVWMANPRAMVVGFARGRARECRSCDEPRGSACDSVCPMRLHPRNIKRMMFSCVQCGQCIDACDQSQEAQRRSTSLEWKFDAEALRETLRQRKASQPEAH